MLHKVCLPPVTRARLTDVVVLQIWLLFYASSKTTLGPGDKQDCAERLNRCPRFSGRGSDIANWIWQAQKTRFGLLKQFAEDTASLKSEKRAWLKSLSREAMELLSQANGLIEPFDKNTAKSWQNTAASFFIGFYEDVLRQAPNPIKKVVGFPPFLFSDPHASQFGAQELLKAFCEENKSGLTICPACDEAPYSVSAGKIYTNTGDIKIEADIDHYLPKESYPHLACHPYNLVPTCPFCNQRKKRNKDPLAKTSSHRRNLDDIFQLYREIGLAKKTFLEIKLGHSPGTSIISEFRPKSDYIARDCILVLQEIYQIPNGWQKPSETTEELLFNDLKSWLDAKDSPFDNPEVIEWLDYYLCNVLEKWGRDAYAILTTWLLTAHIEEAILTFDSTGRQMSKTVLLQRLEPLCGVQNPETSTRLLEKPTVRDRIQRARNWRESQT